MGAILSQLKQYAKQRRLTPLLGSKPLKFQILYYFQSPCPNFVSIMALSNLSVMILLLISQILRKSLELIKNLLPFGIQMELSSLMHWNFSVDQSYSLIPNLKIKSDVILIFIVGPFLNFIIVLFDLFDFNELNSLSIVDLQFMVYFCLTSTFKLYNIKQELNEEAISSFLSDSFSEDNRINISQLVKY